MDTLIDMLLTCCVIPVSELGALDYMCEKRQRNSHTSISRDIAILYICKLGGCV